MTPRQRDGLEHIAGHDWSRPCTAGCLARYRISKSAAPETPLHPRQTGDARRTLDALVMLGYAYQVKSPRPPARFRIREAGRRALGYPDER